MNDEKKYDRIGNLQERTQYSFIRDNMLNFDSSSAKETRRHDGNINQRQSEETNKSCRKNVANYAM